MARITPIDVIKGIRGKYGSGTNDYFATNSSSNNIRLAKLSNPYKGPYTETQLAQQQKFKTRQATATAWLNSNKPSTANPKGTVAYQTLEKLKRSYALSSVTQVLYKYIDAEGTLSLPESVISGAAAASASASSGTGTSSSGSGSSSAGGSGTTVTPATDSDTEGDV